MSDSGFGVPPAPSDPELDRLLREAAQPSGPPEELSRVRARWQTRLAQRRQRWRGLATAGIPLAGAVALALPAWREWSVAQPPRAHQAEPPAIPPPAPTGGPREPDRAASGSAPIPSGALAGSPVAAAHRARRHSGPTVSSASAGAPPEPDLAAETAQLSRAVSELRERHDARGALSTLQGYLRNFPQPHFGPEARFFQIESLVALGRRQEALEELSPALLADLPRRDELSVLRGELLLELGHSDEARQAFDEVVARVHDDRLLERALAGRAAANRALAAGRWTPGGGP